MFLEKDILEKMMIRRIHMNKRKVGMIGEKIAQGYLKDNGYEIIDTNFYTKVGEIDIICKKNNTIVFAIIISYIVL